MRGNQGRWSGGVGFIEKRKRGRAFKEEVGMGTQGL